MWCFLSFVLMVASFLSELLTIGGFSMDSPGWHSDSVFFGRQFWVWSP